VSKKIWIFTDGACSGNPGPGGWAYVARVPNGAKYEIYENAGYHPKSTNNKMELEAVCQALMWLGARENVEVLPIVIFSDSSYVIQGITKWIHGWKKNQWKKSDGSPVLNQEYWQRLDRIVQALKQKISFRYVEAHAGNPANERVDEIAVAFSTLQEIALFEGSEELYTVDMVQSAERALAREKQKPDTLDMPDASFTKIERVAKPRKAQSGKKEFVQYLSFCDGKIERHDTWEQCETRVKKKSGALYKKIKNKAEEFEILKKWGLLQD
jgi:ribonuclease HI